MQWPDNMELLDAEFNPLEVADDPVGVDYMRRFGSKEMHYSSHTNEIVSLCENDRLETCVARLSQLRWSWMSYCFTNSNFCTLVIFSLTNKGPAHDVRSRGFLFRIYLLQQKAKLHFEFQVSYVRKISEILDATCSWTTRPCVYFMDGLLQFLLTVALFWSFFDNLTPLETKKPQRNGVYYKMFKCNFMTSLFRLNLEWVTAWMRNCKNCWNILLLQSL